MAITKLNVYSLGANSVDSDHYVDGSVDLAHMSANSVDSDQYVDTSIDNAHLADDAVGIAELSATGTASATTFLRGDNAWAEVLAGLTLDTTVKTAHFTAVAGNQYLCNTTGGAFNMTLPTSPSAGDTIGIIDYLGTFATNNLTLVQASSKKIFRANANGTIDTNNWVTSIKFIDDTVGWLPAGD